MQNPNVKCGNCKFATIIQRGADAMAQCQRFPPQVYGPPVQEWKANIFPELSAEYGWCGEFKDKEYG